MNVTKKFFPTIDIDVYGCMAVVVWAGWLVIYWEHGGAAFFYLLSGYHNIAAVNKVYHFRFIVRKSRFSHSVKTHFAKIFQIDGARVVVESRRRKQNRYGTAQ